MVAHGQQNGVAQELIALDVRRYADLMQNFCHRQLITILRYRLRAAGGTGGFQYAADQNVFIKRLNEKERKPLSNKSCSTSSLWNAPVTKNVVWPPRVSWVS